MIDVYLHEYLNDIKENEIPNRIYVGNEKIKYTPSKFFFMLFIKTSFLNAN